MLNLFVVSRFGSNANQRIQHLVNLQDDVVRTFIVRESHDKPERQIQHPHLVETSLGKGGGRLLNTVLAFFAALELEAFGALPFAVVLHLGATKRALFRALAQARARGDTSAVILTAPPHGEVVLGPAIKRRFPETSVIIDWQDLWSNDDYYANPAHADFRHIQVAEQRALAAADLNITTNGNAQASLLKLATGAPGQFRVIGHPFDGQAKPLRAPPKGALSRPRKILFLGNLFKPPKVPGQLVIDELTRVANAGVALEFILIGDRYLADHPDFARALPSFVRVFERVTHEEAVARLADADWLMLLLGDLPNTRDIMPSKLPFYLASGVPILAMVPDDSYVAETVRACRAGVVVPPAEGAGELIRQLLLDPPAADLQQDAAQIAEFEIGAVQTRWREAIAAVNPAFAAAWGLG